ncbi:hypothetical protein FHW03_004808 [Ochrobactrum sp. RH2CCR150]|nr:hypothetical protein [Ochrobactrum sp. RH2CCR150]
MKDVTLDEMVERLSVERQVRISRSPLSACQTRRSLFNKCQHSFTQRWLMSSVGSHCIFKTTLQSHIHPAARLP